MRETFTIRNFRFCDSFNRKYVACILDPATALSIGRSGYTKPLKNYRFLFDNCKVLLDSKVDFLFLKSGDNFIGTIKVTYLFNESLLSNCEIGIMLAPSVRGKNFGTSILNFICDSILAINKSITITGGTMKSNYAMIRVFEKNYFRETKGFVKKLGNDQTDFVDIRRFELKFEDFVSLKIPIYKSNDIFKNLTRSLT